MRRSALRNTVFSHGCGSGGTLAVEYSKMPNLQGGNTQTGRLRQTALGASYASICLERTPRTATMALLFSEGAAATGIRLLKLKVGRYLYGDDGRVDIRALESVLPSSEIHLSHAALHNLIVFLETNIRPLKEDKRICVALSDETEAAWFEEFKKHLRRKPMPDVLALIDQHDLLPEDVRRAVALRDKETAIGEFRAALQADENEHFWQAWFERNDWVLGSDFVTVLDDRQIDPEHQGDFLVKAVDGFMEIIEIKRPNAQFWEPRADHGHPVPHKDLTRAVTQGLNYVYELEREMDSVKSRERFQGVPIAKPRALLVHGRSDGWSGAQFLAQRLLNSGLSGIQVFTYDQVLTRARRALAPPSDRGASR